MKFRKRISKNLQKYGYKFTDCTRKLRAYHHVVQDCNLGSKLGERVILDDFQNINFLQKNKNYLILTHPCYWI